jgi:hypothetical protein
MDGGVFQAGHLVLQPVYFGRELGPAAGLLGGCVFCSAAACAHFREAGLGFIGS